MKAVSIIIVCAMAVPFLICVIVIITGALYDRKATRKQQKHHQTYFEQ